MKSSVICEVKALEGDDPNGSFEAILSAATLDRDGEVIDAKAFEPLPDRIPIDIDHGMTVATTVGSGTPYYEGDVLKIKGTFSSIPRAQELRTLVTEGHIARMSVTFMDAKRAVKDGAPHVTSAELLNAAFVPIPSNREAAVLVAKAFAPTAAEVKAGARNNTKDAERLQSIHDLSVDNGAACSTEKARRTADTKALTGSFEERSDQLREAVRAAHPEAWWVQILATFDDSVVYALDDDATYQASYSFSDGALALGTGEPVEVAEVVTPAKSAKTPPEKAAAPAAASPAGDSARRRAAIADAEALLVL